MTNKKTKREFDCSHCSGKVVYHKRIGWCHVFATGCVNPAVNKKDWIIYLKTK